LSQKYLLLQSERKWKREVLDFVTSCSWGTKKEVDEMATIYSTFGKCLYDYSREF
jgi:hypothetical protein